ncbi:MAG: hypothetical protein PUC82_02535 [bacterium]|nr:hypothetical protein [bacterium]
MQKKRIFIIIGIILLTICLALIIYPHIEYQKNGKLYVYSYSEDYTSWEENSCYDDGVSYNKKRNITIKNIELKEFLFFKLFIMDYEDGNLCEKEYYLSENYIKKVIKNAHIIENEHNINLDELIKNKIALELNRRYSLPDNYDVITYKISSKIENMFIYNIENLLVIQIGFSDENPKYIAYIEEIDPNKYNFVDKEWTRETPSDKETLFFSKTGQFSYYCACGSPVDESDLYQNYTYNPGDNTIMLISSYDNSFDKIDIISCNDTKLTIKINNEIKTFEYNEKNNEK